MYKKCFGISCLVVVTVSYSLWLCVPKTLSTQFILTEQISQSWNWISGLNVVINYKSDQRDKVVSDSVVKSFPQQTSLNVSQVHNLLKASTDQKLINSQKSTVNVSDQGSNLTPKLAHEKKTHDHQDCRDVLCTEYLTKEDWENFYKCWRPRRKGRGKTSAAELYITDVNNDRLTSGKCRFMNGTGRGVVGLVSFPGSGNTWVRGLLQAVTGICTGSIYCDRILRGSGFDGEKIQSSSVLVTKEHLRVPRWTHTRNAHEFMSKGIRPRYDDVILIVRNPFNALVSERSRTIGYNAHSAYSHTLIAGPEYFGSNSEWNDFVRTKTQEWTKFFSWLLSCPDNHSVLVVRYEDLQAKVVPETKRMLNFLSFNVSEKVISQRLEAAKFDFHRNSSREFDHFTKEQKQVVTSAIKLVINKLQKALQSTFNVEKYLNQ